MQVSGAKSIVFILTGRFVPDSGTHFAIFLLIKAMHSHKPLCYIKMKAPVYFVWELYFIFSY